MLRLAGTTTRSWVEAAQKAPSTLLLDHAHCEKKAASTAVGCLFRYPERPSLVAAMSRLAREELLHFERVLHEMKRRGEAFARLPPSPYGAELFQRVRSFQPAKLVDELIVAALIEARSCERFALLAEAFAASEPELAALYEELGPSEERHAALYVELAFEMAPPSDIADRIAWFAAEETAILADAPTLPPRLHSG